MAKNSSFPKEILAFDPKDLGVETSLDELLDTYDLEDGEKIATYVLKDVKTLTTEPRLK